MTGLIRWKFEITSKLVGISEAIRLILVFIELNLINLITSFIFTKQNFPSKPQVKSSLSFFSKKTSPLVFSRNMHTAINTNNLSNNDKSKDAENLAFREWLAGIIDGDGYFYYLKMGIIAVKLLWMLEIKKFYI